MVDLFKSFQTDQYVAAIQPTGFPIKKDQTNLE